MSRLAATGLSARSGLLNRPCHQQDQLLAGVYGFIIWSTSGGSIPYMPLSRIWHQCVSVEQKPRRLDCGSVVAHPVRHAIAGESQRSCQRGEGDSVPIMQERTLGILCGD